MNFGIIGYGKMGRKHESVLTSMKINISFVCDKITSEGVKNFYQDYKTAIDEIKVDGIVISTYGPSHYEIISYAIKSGIKFIVCEKPFTVSVKQADKIISLLKDSNTRLCFNYIRRHSEIYRKIFEYLHQENILGIPRSVIITSGAGGISTLGTHFIDLAAFLLNGQIKSVFAHQINKNLPNPRGEQFEDPGGYVILNLDNGSRAFIEMGDDLGLQSKIEVVGEYGRMIIDEFNNELIIRARSAEDRQKRMRLYGLSNPIIKNEKLNFEPIEILIKNMFKNLISTDKLHMNVIQAKEKVEIYSAIRKSFDTKKIVSIPLNNEYYDKEFMVT
jgi:predicted dehydrogenase